MMEESTKVENKRSGKGKGGARQLYIAGAVVLVAIIAIAVYFLSTAAGSSVVVVGDNVSVFYTGSYTNGTVFNTNVGGAPFNFTVGANQVIPGFDSAVVGMRVGENKTVTIPPTEAYGYVNQSRIITYPISVFGSNTPKVGEILGTTSGLEGKVTALNATNATIDFNPPLAGYTLVFNITVAAIRR